MKAKPKIVVSNRKREINSLAELEALEKEFPDSKDWRAGSHILDVVVDARDAQAFLEAVDESRPAGRPLPPRRSMRMKLIRVREARSVNALRAVPPKPRKRR